MKAPQVGTLAFGAVGLVAIFLMMVGAPHDRPPPTPIATSTPSLAGVAANGFALSSTSIDLPADDQQYPPGANADVINANCTSCHSASMALSQPPLTRDQWQATVTKMREVYHAPVAASDIDAIVDYLVSMPAQKQQPQVSPLAHADKSNGDDQGGGTG